MSSNKQFDTQIEVVPTQNADATTDADGNAIADEAGAYFIWCHVTAKIGTKEEFTVTEEIDVVQLAAGTRYDSALWDDFNRQGTEIKFEGHKAETFKPILWPSPARPREIRFDIQYSLKNTDG